MIDTDDPAVQITKPTTDGQSTHDPMLELAFTAQDNSSGIAKIEAVFLDTGDNTVGSFYVCGTGDSRPCLYSVEPTLINYDFYTELPAGTHAIRVLAWDFAGHGGQAQRIVDLFLPGPT